MLMVSSQWADTEEAQNSYAFFRSPASVSCEALIQFKLLSSNCAKTMQDFKYFNKSNFWHTNLLEKHVQLSIDEKKLKVLSYSFVFSEVRSNRIPTSLATDESYCTLQGYKKKIKCSLRVRNFTWELPTTSNFICTRTLWMNQTSK